MVTSIGHVSQRPARPGYWQYPDIEPAVHDYGEGRPRVRADPARRAARELQLGTGLGWLSIGLGAALLLAPRAMARTAGLPDWPMLLRAVGVREIASGLALIRQPDNQAWRWSRVAGDAMDMTVLGMAAVHPRGNRQRLAWTAAAAASIAAVDLRAGMPPRFTPSSQALTEPKGARLVQQSASINRPPEQCYRFWRDLERLPSFMAHLESVTAVDAKRSHWRARGPVGNKVEWDAEITEDQPGRLLGWRTIPGGDVESEGTVRFTPSAGGSGTIVQVQLQYRPPAGTMGAVVAMLFGEEPSQQIKMDLRRFRQLIETGEIPTTKGQSSGKRSLRSRLFRRGMGEQ